MAFIRTWMFFVLLTFVCCLFCGAAILPIALDDLNVINAANFAISTSATLYHHSEEHIRYKVVKATVEQVSGGSLYTFTVELSDYGQIPVQCRVREYGVFYKGDVRRITLDVAQPVACGTSH